MGQGRKDSGDKAIGAALLLFPLGSAFKNTSTVEARGERNICDDATRIEDERLLTMSSKLGNGDPKHQKTTTTAYKQRQKHTRAHMHE